MKKVAKTKSRTVREKVADGSMRCLNIRMPYEMWYFLKKNSLESEISINETVTSLINKYMELGIRS